MLSVNEELTLIKCFISFIAGTKT